jgi:exodeoxyribonuclease VII small subunit
MSERPKRKRKRKEEPAPTFEEALARLEEIARQLEDGDLPLEKAISLAEEGLKLSELCEKQLTQAEGKIEQLVERMGRTELEPLHRETEEADEEA